MASDLSFTPNMSFILLLLIVSSSRVLASNRCDLMKPNDFIGLQIYKRVRIGVETIWMRAKTSNNLDNKEWRIRLNGTDLEVIDSSFRDYYRENVDRFVG